MLSLAVSKETHYVRDGSGNVLAIYENEVLDELVIYGSSRLGSYNGKTLEGKRTLGNKKYELSNHLGNVLAVISDNKIGIGTNGVADYYEPLIISESDYYPFGMAMKERSFSNEEYRFGFNGMEEERDFGSEITDHGARLLNKALGRWFACDPLEFKYPSLSTFSFSNNSPIMFKDDDGREFEITIYRKNKETGSLYEAKFRVLRSEDGTFSLDWSQAGEFVRKGEWIVDHPSVRSEAVTEANKVIKFLNYIASTENEESKQIFELLAKPLTDSGEGIIVDLRFDKTAPLIESGESRAELITAIDTENAYGTAVIDLTRTSTWTRDNNTQYQSSSIQFGAHELGHVFDKLMKAIEGGKTFGLSENEIIYFKTVYSKINQMYDDGDDSYGQKLDNALHEYFATVIQNMFAEGLEEPRIPSYTGGTVDGETVVEKKTVPNATVNSNNDGG